MVRANLDKPRTINYKGFADLVTDTDEASEKAILEASARQPIAALPHWGLPAGGLRPTRAAAALAPFNTPTAHPCPCVQVIRAQFPEHAILGEEGGVSGNTSSDYLWCVDPLDGTTNFAHGYPSFAVCVAALRHATPVAATVIEFCGGPGTWVTRTYTAARNAGARLNGEPISVTRTHEVGQALLVSRERAAGSTGWGKWGVGADGQAAGEPSRSELQGAWEMVGPEGQVLAGVLLLR